MIDLRELMLRESEQVEWKENVADINDVVRTLVAFANDLANLGGGRVVCGAVEGKDDHGFPKVTLVGMTADRIREIRGKVVARCQANVAPSIAPMVDEVQTDDPARRVLVFTIITTGRAHVFRDGDQSTYPVRIDNTTREARNGVLMRLLAARGEVLPWDERLAADATVADLDLLDLRDTLIRLGLWDPNRGVEPWLDPQVSLSTFMPPLCGRETLTGVVRPRHFALLLFGREPQRFIPGAVSSFSRYPGGDRAEPYSERELLGGTVLHQARHLIDRLRAEAFAVTDKSTGGAENIEKYPLRALQEAVINALVHRDYAERDPMRVVAYADRVEIWSPGGLDPRTDRARFLRGDAPPVWRNRALAWLFIRLQLAQSEGQGIRAIQRSLLGQGSAPATFVVSEFSVECTVPAHPRHARMRDLLQIENDLSNGRWEEARLALEALLGADPYNARTLGLLVEWTRLTQNPTPVSRFLTTHRQSLLRLPITTRLALANAMGVAGEPPDLPLLRELLSTVDPTLMPPADLRRLVGLWVLAQEAASVLRILQEVSTRDPRLAVDPELLYWRANAHLQRMHRAASEDRAQHAELAARDLLAALEHGAVGWVKTRVEREIQDMKAGGWWR